MHLTQSQSGFHRRVSPSVAKTWRMWVCWHSQNVDANLCTAKEYVLESMARCIPKHMQPTLIISLDLKCNKHLRTSISSPPYRPVIRPSETLYASEPHRFVWPFEPLERCFMPRYRCQFDKRSTEVVMQAKNTLFGLNVCCVHLFEMLIVNCSRMFFSFTVY